MCATIRLLFSFIELLLNQSFVLHLFPRPTLRLPKPWMKLYTYCRYTYLPVVQDHTPKTQTHTHTTRDILWPCYIHENGNRIIKQRKNYYDVFDRVRIGNWLIIMETGLWCIIAANLVGTTDIAIIIFTFPTLGLGATNNWQTFSPHTKTAESKQNPCQTNFFDFTFCLTPFFFQKNIPKIMVLISLQKKNLEHRRSLIPK